MREQIWSSVNGHQAPARLNVGIQHRSLWKNQLYARHFWPVGLHALQEDVLALALCLYSKSESFAISGSSGARYSIKCAQ